MQTGLLKVEVAYAAEQNQTAIILEVPAGTVVEDAINASGILKTFPEIDLQCNKVGIFGCVCQLDKLLEEGDRIEIYRPLIHEPKSARRLRAEKK